MLPDRQTVTVNFKNRTPLVSLQVAGCIRRPVTADEIAYTNQAGLGIPTAQFMLPQSNAGGNVLKQGDQIIESSGAGQPWTVLRASLELQGTIWRAFVSQE
jgi:hypothetical protein